MSMLIQLCKLKNGMIFHVCTRGKALKRKSNEMKSDIKGLNEAL